MGNTTKVALSLVAGMVFAACDGGQERSDRSDTLLEPSAAPVSAQCRTNGLARSARDYFVRPQQQAATRALSDLEDACAAGDPVSELVFSVLALMEDALAGGVAGDPSDGVALANGLIDYLCAADGALCSPFPEPISEAALGPAGIFAILGSGNEAVTARGSVPFSFAGEDNEALWVVETTAASWSEATGADLILFYGSPDLTTPINPDELSIGDLALELLSFPDVDGFATDNQVHVGVCYMDPVPLPHTGSGSFGEPETVERMQREETILQVHTLVSCPLTWPDPSPSLALAEVVDRAVGFLAQALLPEPLAAALMGDRSASSTGGSAADFSRFAPVAADPEGRLEYTQPPTDGVAGEFLNTIEVQALSGMGTPMERVNVTLVLIGNNGLPAGASFCPTDPEDPDCETAPVRKTVETLSGFDPVATFDVRILKPGGYTICATGEIGGFSFEEDCEVIHIKNN